MGIGGRVWAATGLGFGVAGLCVLPLAAPLVAPDHLLVFHFAGPAWRLFAKVWIDWGAAWLGVSAVLLARRRQAAVRVGLVLLVPWLLLQDWAVIRMWTPPRGLSAGLLLVAMATAVWASRSSRAVELSEGVLRALSVSGCVMLGQMLYCGFAARGLNGHESFGLTGKAGGAGGGARVVVLLFDELGYAQVLGQEASAAELPEFRRLAAESVVFEDVRAESDQTDRAVPALLSGEPVRKVRASADGRQLAMLGDTRWVVLRGGETILGDARRAGYRVGVSGWYNPYCRLLRDVVDTCAWESPAGVHEGLLQDALQPVRRVWRELRTAMPGPGSEREDWPAAEHVRNYQRITAAGDAMLRDERLGFVFLHLPIPHPGGVYDRRTGRLGGMTGHGEKTGYRDNLALADRYLGHVRQVLEGRGEWNRATVVVLGDHGWRTKTWRKTAEWTPEDEAASLGGGDARPALLVKLAGEHGGAVVTGEFQERRLRELLAGVERGTLQTAEQAARWAAAHATERGSVKR